MLHFYIAVIRPVLQYAVSIWHTGLTADLSDQLQTSLPKVIWEEGLVAAEVCHGTV